MVSSKVFLKENGDRYEISFSTLIVRIIDNIGN